MDSTHSLLSRERRPNHSVPTVSQFSIAYSNATNNLCVSDSTVQLYAKKKSFSFVVGLGNPGDALYGSMQVYSSRIGSSFFCIMQVNPYSGLLLPKLALCRMEVDGYLILL